MSDEHAPLLGHHHSDHNNNGTHQQPISDLPSLTRQQETENVSATDLQAQHLRIRRFITGPLLVFVLFILIGLLIWGGGDWESKWLLRGNPHTAAERVLSKWPIIDGHIDLPILVREFYANNISAIDLREPSKGHLDIPRARQGHLGGFVWSVWVPCPGGNETDGGTGRTDPNGFDKASWRVRDTLEQIDVARLLIDQYPTTFQLALSADDGKQAIRQGRIASWLGVEGGHQLGNSLAVLRMYYQLGVRYVTLTHMCHNAFADSAGFLEPLPPLHYGLSPFGEQLIKEMNRLGMMIDISHTSDETALQAIAKSRAPVIWSHSSSRELWDVARNVPSSILSRIGLTKDKRDAVIMVNFAPFFIGPEGKVDVKKVADHVDMIGKRAGRMHVGIGSDFDGIPYGPIGLEDVSKYPNLIAALIKRGWRARELQGLCGGNFLRVMEGVEGVKREIERENRKAWGAGVGVDWWEGRGDYPEDAKMNEL